jgi:hypothetical protein
MRRAAAPAQRSAADSDAEYGTSSDRTVYPPITPEGVRNALWLFAYGFPPAKPGVTQHVDGC